MVKLFMHNIFKYHGMPQSIVSDRDPRMTSLFWKALFEIMGTTLKFSSSFHPQTDGQSEEANSFVQDLLKCYVSEHKATWEHYLLSVEYAYNNIVHTSTGKAPFEIVEGARKSHPFCRLRTRYLRQTNEKELPEEEAVCRICMLELEEGNETFKMECSCKGELALAHKDCAMKWFSVKGNNRCDICNSVVSNLPVLLFRRSSSLLRGNASAGGNVGNAEVNSSWHRTAVLLLSSALTTFWHKLQDLSEFP
ncbi:hypothetical protein L7F22_017345 [Adiantum nelumboides]|nr:hypothetical protein [Adiantum nelumboides]